MAKIRNNIKIKKNILLRCLEYRIFHIQDSPHKIALGLALGLFIGWTPLIGLHIFIAVIVSFLLRANKFAAFVSVWVSNVFTFVIIYYPSYLFGRFILNFFDPERTLTSRQVLSAMNNLFSPSNLLAGFYTKEYWQQFWVLTKSIGPELWLGSIIIGGVVAVGSYFICLNIIKAHRAKNPHRRYRILITK
ncbi:MAG: hypothetical protein A2Y10_04420 [Planctomycetes bacterium GWF2_41_51]|nr:MAG: hypothetical protein A2Y10_04420 [Planctomycetes bacterium GWF2_41_51]HBG27030.1 hypothetical protein [Phycisphaerales bacterium]